MRSCHEEYLVIRASGLEKSEKAISLFLENPKCRGKIIFFLVDKEDPAIESSWYLERLFNHGRVMVLGNMSVYHRFEILKKNINIILSIPQLAIFGLNIIWNDSKSFSRNSSLKSIESNSKFKNYLIHIQKHTLRKLEKRNSNFTVLKIL